MTSQILLILIDFDSFSGTFLSETTHIQTFITLELEQILRNSKLRSSWFLLLFQIQQ